MSETYIDPEDWTFEDRDEDDFLPEPDPQDEYPDMGDDSGWPYPDNDPVLGY